jgi:hypothetical protein
MRALKITTVNNNHLGDQVRRDIQSRLGNQHNRVVYGSCQHMGGKALSTEGCLNCQWMMISLSIYYNFHPIVSSFLTFLRAHIHKHSFLCIYSNRALLTCQDVMAFV